MPNTKKKQSNTTKDIKIPSTPAPFLIIFDYINTTVYI